MAADLNLDWLCSLPPTWSYGVTRDGRIFFLNEEAKSTTWLHPVSGEAVLTGHRKTPDLPTGWEEGYTFEGARCYINHNERKVTCKHPVTGEPSQDNCIFIVNDQSIKFGRPSSSTDQCETDSHLKEEVKQRSVDDCIVSQTRTTSVMASQEKKDRTISTVSDASNYNMASDYAIQPGSPLGRTSRSSKKIHSFGKRSNSIKRNPNAPVIKRGWLYKQDSSGMKLWKKRWFVLSDLCLFYYRDEKEEGILGSILLPSFRVSLLMPDDHINRKYSFKATHPNMRTYYFCTDTAKEMEVWMKVMTDAALVQTEPVKRAEKITCENLPPQGSNNISNHSVLTKPEVQNNQINAQLGKADEKNVLEAEKYGFHKDRPDKPLTKVNSIKHHHHSVPDGQDFSSGSAQSGQYRSVHISDDSGNKTDDIIPCDTASLVQQRAFSQSEPERNIQRTNSMLQLEQWVRMQKGGKGPEEEITSVTSYQTLPRNMPSYRQQVVPRYPEGYRTLPRNCTARPDSICSMTPSVYDRVIGSAQGEEKRRSMRDDTMWQLYEWQQRHYYSKNPAHSRPPPLSSPKTMMNISEHTPHSIPTSPSHGSISAYQGYPSFRSYNLGSRSEVSSPVFRGDLTVDRRHRTSLSKHGSVPDGRSVPAGLLLQPITPQSLQGKTVTQDECRSSLYSNRIDDLDVDAKLSRLCEQDKAVRLMEEKLQQLHKEKYTLEQALLSVSQEIEMNADNHTAVQNVLLQRDDLQNGLLSTCREVSRATAELERAWREYDRLEYDVTVARNNTREKLDRLENAQSETACLQRTQLQKDLWRIKDVMEGLSKHKQQRLDTDIMGAKPFSSRYKNEGPDYRLYKSEPELTTVAEVDESNGDDRTDTILETENTLVKGMHYPVGVVPPRTKSPTLESSTIASYVTLRKTKIEPKGDRPRSAVEQLCLAEGPRPRMSVEEQMERIKRHQQASLREKKKTLNLIGASDQSPSRSPSFSKDNPFKSTQVRRREDVVSIQELEAAIRGSVCEQNHETPAEEIARLKVSDESDSSSVPVNKDQLSKTLSSPEKYIDSDLEHVVTPEDEADKLRRADRIKAITGKNSFENTDPLNHISEFRLDDEPNMQKPEKIVNISYEFATETSRSNCVTGKDLSSPPQSPSQTSPTSPATPTQQQLTEGSHFMCV